MSNVEIDREFWKLYGEFQKWKNEAVDFIDSIDDPTMKKDMTDLLLTYVGMTKLDIMCRTKQIIRR